MNDNSNIIKNYYENYGEDERFKKDLSHSVEYLTTKKYIDENYKMKDIPEEIFSAFRIDEFNKLMDNYDIEHLKDVATDGLSTVLREYVNELTDEEFKVWLDYHYKTCEIKDLQGYSTHMLYIGKKR